MNSSLYTNAALESGWATGQGMTAGEFLDWMGQHCTAGSHHQSAQHTTRTRPFATEELGDDVQDPGAAHAGMFCQEHKCTTDAPHPLCGQSIMGCVLPSLLSRGRPRGEEETRARG